MSAPNEQPGVLGTEQWDRLEQTIKRFEEAWQAGQRPALDAYLAGVAEGRLALLVELLHIDLEYRLKAGEQARVEAYLQRYADVARDRAAALGLICREYELRGRREPDLAPEEYAARFPQYRAELAARLVPPHTVPPEVHGDVHDETVVEAARQAVPPVALTGPAGTPIDSVPALVRVLRSSRLLRAGQLEELASLEQTFHEPRSLARELLQRNWLTAYQANQVFQGRERNLAFGPYVLLERLGEGGMGTVFKARHQLMDRVVALKVIKKEQLANEDAIRRFHREIRAASALQHPNIVMAQHADEVNGTHFLVMEYVEGTDLAKVVRKQGPLPPEKACDCVRQAALGLQHAHERGLVHRDIKPANLLLSKDGVVKILDMGLARLGQNAGDQTAGELTQEGSVMGTPDYMAPEQAEESHTVDIRADIYSLGCTLHHLLTGEAPFSGGTLIQKLYRHMSQEPPAVESRRPGLPVGLGAVARRMMAKKPQDRYQTPAEAAAALGAFCGAEANVPVATVSPDLPRPPVAHLVSFGGTTAPVQVPAAAIVAAPVSAPAGDRTLPITVLPPIPSPSPFAETLRSLWANPRRRWIAAGTGGGLVLLLLALVLLRPAPPPPPPIERTFLDRLDPANIPEGDRFAWQPPGLVAVLGEHRLRERDGNPLYRLALSPDGKWVATAGMDGMVRLADTATLHERQLLRGHNVPVYDVAFSPDGKRLASAGCDKTVRLWDLASGKEGKRCEGHTEPVYGVAFSADGQLLASAGYDKTVRLWDATTGKKRKELKGHLAPVWCVAFSPDGRHLFSGGGGQDAKGNPLDCSVRMWDVKTGEETGRRFDEAKLPVRSLSPLAESDRLLVGAGDGLWLWDLGDGKGTRRLSPGQIAGTALARDGLFALSGYDAPNNLITVWEVGNWRAVRQLPYPSSSMAFLPDGRRVLFLDKNNVRAWDREDHKEVLVPVGHTGSVTALAFSRDGRYLVSGGDDLTVRLWDLEQVKVVRSFAGQPFPVVSVALSLAERQILSCYVTTQGDWVSVWDMDVGREVRQLKRTTSFIRAVATSADGRYALALHKAEQGTKPKTSYAFALWELATGKEVRRFEGHTSTVNQLGFLAGGAKCFSQSQDGTVRLWEVATGKELKSFSWQPSQVVFTDDVRTAWTGHGDGSVNRWDLTAAKPAVFTYPRLHEANVRSLSVSPDGKRLATAGDDNRLILWQADGIQKIAEWSLPERVNAVAFSPEGRHLALANANGTIYILRPARP